MTDPVTPEPTTGAAKTPSPAELKDQGRKLLMELGPLLVFVVANGLLGPFPAIGLFMVATAIGLVASYLTFKRVPIMLLVSGVLVLAFGALAYAQNDKTIFQLKPTVVNLLFAATMLIGLAFNWLVWKYLFGTVFQLTDEGWRKLQFRWGILFLFFAGLNELFRLNLDFTTWGYTKFVSIPISMIFMLTQIPLLNRHALKDNSEAGSKDV